MAHVAREMERQGFKLPLLIGGATTSRAHTAVKIAPHYSEPVVHVLDASRAVPVTTSLLSHESKPAFVAAAPRRVRRSAQASTAAPKQKLRAAGSRAREPHADRLARRGSADARSSGACACSTTSRSRRCASTSTGRRSSTPGSSRASSRASSSTRSTASRRGKIFAEGNALLDVMVDEKLIRARGVYGFFPRQRASATTSSSTATRGETRWRASISCASRPAKDGEPSRCLADFVAPAETGLADHIGGFAVTTGIGLKELCDRFRAKHDDYNAIMAEALADRLAEAFAEYLHERVRRQWGYGRDEGLSKEQLIREEYRGIRPAAGYPACPDHTEKGDAVAAARRRTQHRHHADRVVRHVAGLERQRPLLRPPRSRATSRVGKLGRDQLVDYHARKGMTLAEAERWLGPNLGYDPAADNERAA